MAGLYFIISFFHFHFHFHGLLYEIYAAKSDGLHDMFDLPLSLLNIIVIIAAATVIVTDNDNTCNDIDNDTSQLRRESFVYNFH